MPTSDNFTGFDQTRHALHSHEARVHVYLTMANSIYFIDERVAFVHVDNTSRLDRMLLTAFDDAGSQLGSDVIYNDDGRGLDEVPEFSPRLTGLMVSTDSALGRLTEDGWVIDMEALCSYDILADRKSTQRTMALALLSDMIVDGEARCLLFGSDLSGSDAPAA